MHNQNREFFGCCCDIALGSKVVAIILIFLNILMFFNGAVMKINVQNKHISNEDTFQASMAVACIDLLFNISLFYGTFTKRPGFILAWIIKEIIALTLSAFILIILFVFISSFYLTTGLIFLIVGGIFFTIFTHIVICVNHHYKELVNINKNSHNRLYEMSA